VDAGLLDEDEEFEFELDLSEPDDELEDFSVDDDFSAGLSDDFSEGPDDSPPPPEPLMVLFEVSRLSLR
jgi:hypothetical protein